MHAVRVLVICTTVLLGAAVASAAPPAKGGGAEGDAIRVFLAEVAGKLKAKDLKYLQQRVKLPFRMAWLSEGNEQKATLRKPADVAKSLTIETGLLRLLASATDLEKTRAGGCDMGEGKVIPNAGPMVLVLKGKKATVTAPPGSCEGQGLTNTVYELAPDKKGEWQLVSRGYIPAASAAE